MIHTVFALADHDAFQAVQHAAVAQLGQIAVERVGFFVQFLEEQDLASKIRLIERAAASGEQTEIAAQDFALRFAGGDRGQELARIRQRDLAARFCRRQAAKPVVFRVGRDAAVERGQHFAVDRDQAGELMDRQVQRRNVRIPAEQLGISLDVPEIDPVDELQRAVAAAGAQDHVHVPAGEHLVQILGSRLFRGRDIVASPFVHVFTEDDVVSQTLEERFSSGNSCRVLRGAGRRDDGDGIAGFQLPGFDHRVLLTELPADSREAVFVIEYFQRRIA